MQYRITTLVIAAIGLLAACSGSSDEQSGFRTFDAQQREQIENQAEISLNHNYSSQVEAFVLGGYRAVGVENEQAHDYPENSSTGTVLFAQCEKGVTFEDCSRTVPTLQKPHAYVDGSWIKERDGSVSTSISGDIHWRATVKKTMLDCTASFQLNPYSIKQVPEALSEFAAGNKVQTGKLEVEFPPNPNPKGDYSMGQGPYDVRPTLWTCTTL